MTTQATFAATLVDEWIRCGVRHAVISPGSRSTPLALALAQAKNMNVHVHLDERSAAFMALGIGMLTQHPAVVLTTSGTAAVELHPAVVEASYAQVPLLVCTADRPPSLHDVGAPQAIDQTHLYGRSVRWFFEPGLADSFPIEAWRSLAARSVAETTGANPGPVHLNLAFAEPLLGEPDDLPAPRGDGRPWHQPIASRVEPQAANVDEIVAALRFERGVIVAGGPGLNPADVQALAGVTQWPVLADPRSGCRVPGPNTVGAFDALLRNQGFADSHRPEVVVRLGDLPASKVLNGWLSNSGATQVLINGSKPWIDPARLADWVISGDPSTWCRALSERFTASGNISNNGSWLSSWMSAEDAAQKVIETTLDRSEISEPGVARQVLKSLPDDSTLLVSSSMPIRDVECFGQPRNGIRIVANRGANGIDGVVSTAVGIALASERPTTLLIGDLAFLHDTNGLLNLAARNVDLTIVVIDNRGGGIFSFLPPASALDQSRFEQLFGTPQSVDLVGLIAAHGLATIEAHDPQGLDAALLVAKQAPGTHVVLVRTERKQNVLVHEQINTNVSIALDSLTQESP